MIISLVQPPDKSGQVKTLLTFLTRKASQALSMPYIATLQENDELLCTAGNRHLLEENFLDVQPDTPDLKCNLHLTYAVCHPEPVALSQYRNKEHDSLNYLYLGFLVVV